MCPLTFEQDPDVSPQFIPIELVERPMHLICGTCGFNGDVEFVVFTEKPWVFDPVCHCPIPGVLCA